MKWYFDFWDILLWIAMLCHLSVCPYTKVEESFNLQATHDILYHNVNIEKYDHHEFPGVVPRTFIGSLFVSILSYPFSFFTATQETKFSMQMVVRSILGSLLVFATTLLRKEISFRMGNNTGIAFIIVHLIQFHLLFYYSRTLPNTFALCLMMLAYVFYLRDEYIKVIAILAFTTLVFRFEIIVLSGPIVLQMLLNRRISFFEMLKYGFIFGSLSILISISIDSIFWRRLLWPEGDVMWFNTFMNKSNLWGVSPFYWYFLVAIPKVMNFTIIFFLCGVILVRDRYIMELFVSATIYVMLYSILPHKELRFIFYVFPIFNTVAAIGLVNLWSRARNKLIIFLFALGLIIGSLIVSMGLLYISSMNYPGGHALNELHKIERENIVNVHIDVDAAMTGVSKFCEIRNSWNYWKTENQSLEDKLKLYTHLITGNSTIKDSPSLDIIAQVDGFDRLSLRPFTIITKPIYILKKKT